MGLLFATNGVHENMARFIRRVRPEIFRVSGRDRTRPASLLFGTPFSIDVELHVRSIDNESKT